VVKTAPVGWAVESPPAQSARGLRFCAPHQPGGGYWQFGLVQGWHCALHGSIEQSTFCADARKGMAMNVANSVMVFMGAL
jgi:hypothetical protein